MHTPHSLGSQLGAEGTADNTPLIEEILRLRQEQAELLGYAHYAELSCASKMATFQSATELLTDLQRASFGAATAELIELGQFAQSRGLEGEMEPWDRTFYAERLREDR